MAGSERERHKGRIKPAASRHFGLPVAARKRGRREGPGNFALLTFPEQAFHVAVECAGHGQRGRDGRDQPAPFDRADAGPRDACLRGKLQLRKARAMRNCFTRLPGEE